MPPPPRSTIPSSSSRPPRDLEDALIFSQDKELVKDWYIRQLSRGSTTIKTMQLRKEHVAPFHQFIVVQTQACAYRVDRGRERVRGSLPDTIRGLGVPPRDTIALIKEPLEELDRTSRCAKELFRRDGTTLDLSFVLGICFRIHNIWGTRYDLVGRNCYFFAQTIISTCDDKLDKESKSILRLILEKLYRLLALLLWVVLLMVVLVLRLIHFWNWHKIQPTPAQVPLGFVLGGVNMLLVMPMLLQVRVALAVRWVVIEVVQLERELQPQQQGEVLEPDPELGQQQALRMELERVEARTQSWAWARKPARVRVLQRVLVMGVNIMLPLVLAVAPLLLSLLPPFSAGLPSAFGVGFLFGELVLVCVIILLAELVEVWRAPQRSRAVRAGSGRPLDTSAEGGGIVGVGAAVEPEQEQVELANREANMPEDGWTAVMVATEDQAEGGVATGTATEVVQVDDMQGYSGNGIPDVNPGQI